MQSNEAALFDLLGDLFKVSPDSIDMSSTPATISGWDSLTHLRVVTGIEKTFSISLSPTDAVSLRSVGDIVTMLEGKGIQINE